MTGRIYRELPDGSRASHGADEFIFVEVSESMSLEAALRVQAITARVTDLMLPGLIDVAPANASYLLRMDPDLANPRFVMDAIAELHADRDGEGTESISTRIIEIPVFYDDPWTHEVCMRFRHCHQSDDETDLEFVARINGFSATSELIAAHTSAPFIVTFPCFKPGNAESYQLVPRDRQIQAPKYVSPRTQTPERAVAHGGCFTVVYPTDGVGGYQLLGIAAVPVVDLAQRQRRFQQSMVLTPISTLIQFRAINREEYAEIRIQVERDAYRLAERPVTFSSRAFNDDPEGYIRALTDVLT